MVRKPTIQIQWNYSCICPQITTNDLDCNQPTGIENGNGWLFRDAARIVDAHLYHIRHITEKITKKLCVLKKITWHLTIETARMLYDSIVLPVFDYCDVAIGNLNNSLQDGLQKWQNYGTRNILGRYRHSYVADMFIDSGVVEY